MATIAVRGVGSADASQQAITPGLPSGWQPGDILVLLVEAMAHAISGASPAGWTECANSPQGSAVDQTRLTVFGKRAAVGEPAPATTDSANHQVGRILAF